MGQRGGGGATCPSGDPEGTAPSLAPSPVRALAAMIFVVALLNNAALPLFVGRARGGMALPSTHQRRGVRYSRECLDTPGKWQRLPASFGACWQTPRIDHHMGYITIYTVIRCSILCERGSRYQYILLKENGFRICIAIYIHTESLKLSSAWNALVLAALHALELCNIMASQQRCTAPNPTSRWC